MPEQPPFDLREARDMKKTPIMDQRPVEEQAKTAARTDGTPLIMPGERQEIAQEVEKVGAEGIPGDPKAGPGLLRLEVVALALLLIGVAVGVGIWFGWLAGVGVLAIFAVSIALNPVVLASMGRAKDRTVAAQHINRGTTVATEDEPVPMLSNRDRGRPATEQAAELMREFRTHPSMDAGAAPWRQGGEEITVAHPAPPVKRDESAI